MILKRFLLTLLCLLLVPVTAQARPNVFACEPEWGALVKEIGGEGVDVSIATTARQDAHHASAKPSLLAAMRKADLVFCNGASLEIGWLPVLQQKAAGPDTVFLYAADHVEKLDIPAKIDRAMGDVHPDGNPHILLDPHNIAAVADAVAERLEIIDPENAQGYKTRLAVFQENWQRMTTEWERQGSGLKGTDVVVYHVNWAYLLRWLGMNSAAALEPKPGIPPTASHLEDVLASMQGRTVRAILVAPYENEQAAQWLSKKTGIPVVRLPYTVGGTDRADTLEHLFDETIRLLNEASS